MTLRAAAAAAICLLTYPAWAAEITLQGTTITFTGPIAWADVATFVQASRGARILVLNSPGGEVDAAIAIGSEVRRLKLETVVPQSALCASGCSILFFAGVKRELHGSLGVHSAWIKETGLRSPLGTDRMIFWLELWGAPVRVLLDLNDTAPREMYWFGAAELREFERMERLLDAEIARGRLPKDKRAARRQFFEEMRVLRKFMGSFGKQSEEETRDEKAD
jgi:hypothetical protein